jgi:O-antigen/teichoic acid export membrane protein
VAKWDSGFWELTQALAHDFKAWSAFINKKRLLTGVMTLLTELTVLLSGMMTLKLAGSYLGTIGFGEYSIARRAMDVVTFPILLGLGISIPRYVAFCGTKSRHSGINSLIYLLAGLGISIPVNFLLGMLVLNFPARFTALFFGEASYAHLAFPIVLTCIGLYLQTLTYSYLRGLIAMRSANLFRFFTSGFIPPVALLFSEAKVSRTLIIIGSGWIAVSIVFIVWLFWVKNSQYLRLSIVFRCAFELLRYGIPRVPGELALFGLFAAPTFMISHRFGVEFAGFFSFGLSLLRLVGAMFAVIGILFLPYISRLSAEKRWDTIKRQVAKVLFGSIILSGVVVVLLQLTLKIIVPFWMGDAFIEAVRVSRWLLWAAVPYVIYIVLRNPIDAITTYPYNSVNLVFAFGFVMIAIGMGASILEPQLAMFLAMALLSVLTLISWQRSLSYERGKVLSIRGEALF